jgi:hypothetical protein
MSIEPCDIKVIALAHFWRFILDRDGPDDASFLPDWEETISLSPA